MGTRALTFVYNEHNEVILNLYRQYDGYIEGHGAELAEFLAGKTLVNGFGKESTSLANGMGCLAASLVAHFKETVGGFYIHSVTSTDCGQDYEYHVYKDRVKVLGPGSIFNPGVNANLFEGSWAEFAKFCKVEVSA
ncbi:MAG: hypothetical protein EB101_04590 [Chitinophagia bacterium]|nr:hypothetical protein [Chitinophagia bacterium]